jgi:hypothetical protein
MKIKLRREWQGQDSWGAFVEEVAINPDDLTLAYRISTGGNCEYGEWKDWQDETDALRFMLGPIKATSGLRAQLYSDMRSSGHGKLGANLSRGVNNGGTYTWSCLK